MTDNIEAVATDLQHALDQVVLAVIRTIPAGSDIIDPPQVVKQWIVQLAPEARARFFMHLLSQGSESHFDGMASAVLTGDNTWTRPDPEVVMTPVDLTPRPEPDTSAAQ